MNNASIQYGSPRFRSRVLTYILFPLVILTLILMGSVYSIGRSNILKTTQDDLDSECSIMVDKIYSSIRSQESSLQYQSIRSGLLSIESNDNSDNQVYMNHRLRNYIDYMNIGDLHVDGVYYYNELGVESCLYTGFSSASLQHFHATDAYKYWESLKLDMFQRGGSVVWRRFSDDPDHLYLYKYVLNVEPMYYKGMLCSVIDKDFLVDLLQFSDRVLILFDENGNLLCGDTTFTTLEEFRENAAKEKIAVYSVDTVSRSGWQLVMGVTGKTATRELHSIMNILFILACAEIIIFLYMEQYVTRTVTKNIAMLSDNFRLIQQGQKPLILTPVPGDETADLCLQFNHMQSQLEDNAVRMAEDNTLLERAEYNALIQQLNPHFLYNVLESISAMARLHNEPEIVEAVRLLSGMLRQSLRDHRQEVPLSDELNYIRSYLTLQSILTGGSLTWDIDSDEETGQCLIPRLMLQPLIENAIVHGLKDKLEDGIIVVSARIDSETNDPSDKNLLLMIMDNGSGDTNEHLSSILSDSELRDVNRAHIGLNNIQRRIRILYGSEYGMKFESEENNGLIIRIRIPYHVNPVVNEGDMTQNENNTNS